MARSDRRRRAQAGSGGAARARRDAPSRLSPDEAVGARQTSLPRLAEGGIETGLFIVVDDPASAPASR
jgi:hypothetical protein